MTIDDGSALEYSDITPAMAGGNPEPMWLSRFWKGLRPVIAFPVRLLTSLWANGVILLIGVLAIAIGSVILLGILSLIIAALVLCLFAIVLFAMSFGLVRIGDWISGTKTLAFLPKVLHDAASRVNVTEDIGNVRAHTAARRSRRS